MIMEKLKTIKWDDIPQEYQKQIRLVPTEPFYVVVDEEGQEMGMNDSGGRKRYGIDWELIRDGEHPDFTTSKLEVTIH